MKKIVPIVMTLIAASIIGVVWLQVLWIKNLLQLRQDQLYSKVWQSVLTIATTIADKEIQYPVASIPRISNFVPPIENLYPRSRVHFSNTFLVLDSIQQYIKTTFNKDADLRKLHFEFSILRANGDYEMHSNNFEKAYWDTIHNKVFITHLTSNPTNKFETIPQQPDLLVLVIPSFERQVYSSLTWNITLSGVLILVVLIAFGSITMMMLNQKRISAVKSDFMNNMTHEFKTPLATIALASDALRTNKIICDKEKIKYFALIIKEENTRMNKIVGTILDQAIMKQQGVQLNIQPIAVHKVLTTICGKFELLLHQKESNFNLSLGAPNDIINADDIHFTNAIANLVDNAIKYCKENEPPTIKITTHNIGKNIILTIEDKGIGMIRATAKKIFDQFYRAHTGNVHNTKGFGLGLYYTKLVISAHKGKIKVASALNKGTTFTIILRTIQ